MKRALDLTEEDMSKMKVKWQFRSLVWKIFLNYLSDSLFHYDNPVSGGSMSEGDEGASREILSNWKTIKKSHMSFYEEIVREVTMSVEYLADSLQAQEPDSPPLKHPQFLGLD